MAEDDSTTAGTPDCPDPAPHYVTYQVDAAAAKKESELYTADAAVVDKAWGRLEGAQKAYTAMKAERQAAYDELDARLARIRENLEHLLGEPERNRLKGCWDEVVAGSTSAPPDCGEIDDEKKVDCAALPADIAKLRAWAATASACVAAADAEFDRLADLPKTLGAVLTELAGPAATLETEVCGARAEPERRFVEYLDLRRRFDALAKDWRDPIEYVCALRKQFVLLKRRHTVSICLQVAVLRWDKTRELEDAAKGAQAKNVVDLVLLRCAQRPAQNGAGTTGDRAGSPAPSGRADRP